MKKIFLMLAAAGMLFSSCQKDENLGGTTTGEALVTVNATVPQAVAVRAAAAYSDSAKGGVINADDAKYDLRFILKVYEGETVVKEDQWIDEINALSHQRQYRLVPGHNYTFVVWADIVDEDTEADLFYNTSAFPSITEVAGKHVINEEARDAYFVTETIAIEENANVNLTLKRPFGKVRVVTTDWKEDAVQNGGAPTSVTITYNDVDVYAGINIKEGSLLTKTTATNAYTAEINNYSADAEGEKTLYVDYIWGLPATEGASATNVEQYPIHFTIDAGIRKYDVKADVPVTRNWLTTVKGNILTTNTNININVDPNFGNNHEVSLWDGTSSNAVTPVDGVYQIKTAAELAWIAEQVNAGLFTGGTVKLMANIDLNNKAWTPIGFNSNENVGGEKYFTGTFDGGNFTISNLKINETDKGGVGLFGAVYNATFKNITLNNVDVKVAESEANPEFKSGAEGYPNYIVGGHIGALVGYDAKAGTVAFENVHITGLIKIESETRAPQGQRVGGIMGGRASSTVSFKNVTVKGDTGSYIKGYCSTGGVFGQHQAVGTFEDVHTDIDVQAVTFGVGGIVGTSRHGSTFTNCSSAGDISLVGAKPLSTSINYLYRVGGIAGSWSETATSELTLTNCSYTGTLSGVTTAGETPIAFDCAGFVGRSYGVAVGATVIVNGVNYVYQGNGVYTIDGVWTYFVNTIADLQSILDNISGNAVINLTNDLAGDVTVTEKQDLTITINGNNNKYDGQISIYGNSSDTNSTLILKNINFETSTDSQVFIYAFNSAGGDYSRYPDNVTVENCTFTAVAGSAAVHTAAGAKFRSNQGVIKMTGCTATNMHSLMQAESCGEESVSVEGATVINGKNGVSFNNTKVAKISNSTITATGAGSYGVRVKGEQAGYSLTVSNCTISAFVPVLVRNMTATSYAATLEGNNTLTASGANPYQVVFCKGDYDGTAALVAPTGTYTVTGTDNFNVYPNVDNKPLTANSTEQVDAIIAAGATNIKLTAGTYVIPHSAQGKTLTIVGTGNPEDVKIATKDDGSYEGCNYAFDGSTVTFENISINTPSTTYIGYARCKGTYKNCVINGTFTLYDNSTFEDCTFNVSGDVYNIWTWGAKEVKFTRCTFNSDGKALLLYQEGTNTVNLTVDTCTFNDKGGLTSKKAAIEIGDAPYGATPTYNVTVSGTTVNGYEINNEGINTGTTLWGNKNSMPTNRLNVKVDGVDVY